MTAPGHAHSITLTKNPNRIKVIFNGAVIADTKKGLILKEGPLPPVTYIPREDVRMSFLKRTNHSTHCPFKGEAAYYSVNVDSHSTENAVWTYEHPIESVAAIKNYVCFYPDKMDAIEEIPDGANTQNGEQNTC